MVLHKVRFNNDQSHCFMDATTSLQIIPSFKNREALYFVKERLFEKLKNKLFLSR